MSKEQYSVSLDDDLVEWADDNYARMGFQSRSAMINAALASWNAASEASSQ